MLFTLADLNAAVGKSARRLTSLIFIGRSLIGERVDDDDRP